LITEVLSGFLFLCIMVTNIASGRFGYETFSDLNVDTKLQKIASNPKKFRIGSALILVEHISIICLAVTLFLAFSPYNMLLAIIWTISRTGEGLIQIYNKKSYWGLLDMAKKHASSSGSEKTALTVSARGILETKNNVFTFAQVLFSIGTLAYSILFAISGVVPDVIGWFGIVAGVIYGFGSGLKLVKPDFKALWSLGGLLIFIFELVLGGWLLFSFLL
jgi:hypothetical protein